MITPDNARSYELHLEKLIQAHGRDVAMELVVGGQYHQIGILETSALITLGLQPDDTVVDVGCGSGRLPAYLKSYLRGKYVGTDILAESIEFAREKCGRDDWHFIQNHQTTIPVPDGIADFVTFFSVFTHLLDEDIFRFLAEAKRVAKPGGRIVFSFLDFECESHWSLFEQTIADARPERVINKFVAKSSIRRWTRALALTEERIYDGADRWVQLVEPFTYSDGRRAGGGAPTSANPSLSCGTFPRSFLHSIHSTFA